MDGRQATEEEEDEEEDAVGMRYRLSKEERRLRLAVGAARNVGNKGGGRVGSSAWSSKGEILCDNAQGKDVRRSQLTEAV